MPKGVYIRTQKHIKAMSGRLSSQKQLKAGLKNFRIARTLPRSLAQIENARNMGLSNNANTIVEHHNDLCHGRERPDDVTYMTLSEHISLHHKLRVQDGTHNWLAKKRNYYG